MLKLMGKKTITVLCCKKLLNWPYGSTLYSGCVSYLGLWCDLMYSSFPAFIPYMIYDVYEPCQQSAYRIAQANPFQFEISNAKTNVWAERGSNSRD